MHYLSDGRWAESQEIIESVPGGAVARQGQVRVQFANDLATAGAIDLETPDGKHLTSHVFGLCYFDAASGTNVLIAGVTNSLGRIVSPNQVVYENAFDGLSASVRYTYTRGGFEQDILLHEVPAPPSAYGLNPASTRLVVMTEFLNPPQPAMRQELAKNDGAGIGLEDESLDFGTLQIGVGTGFPLGTDRRGANLRIFKQWVELEGRRFLLEQVPAGDFFKAIDSLPRKEGASVQPDTKAIRFTAKGGQLPLPQPRKVDPSPMELASRWVPGRSYVLDYATVVSTNNFTFRGDTTYYVTGPVTFSGTATFEGGTVIKFTNSPSAKLSPQWVKCATGPYRMAYLTSKDDDSIGETILGSTGSPTNYNGATYLQQWALTNLQYLRFSYAGKAVQAYAMNNSVSHCQFVRCSYALHLNTSFIPRFGIFNCLFARCGCVISATAGYGEVTCQHVTADGGSFDDDASNQIGLVNCILTDCPTRGAATLSNSVTNGYAAEIFQNVGAGAYYLADSSPYRNAGTTNVSGGLETELRQLTTYPPLVYSNIFISTATSLGPQAQRDTDTPDLAYHYPPLDYAVCGLWVTNTTLEIQPGTTVATFGQYGIALFAGSEFSSKGVATNLNHIARYNLVQEGSTTNWNRKGDSVRGDWWIGGTRSQMKCRFTDWSMAAQDDYLVYNDTYGLVAAFTDCQFRGGKLYIDSANLAVTNCLFERVYTEIAEWAGATSVSMRNCLAWGGQFTLGNFYESAWSFRDNAFDHTVFDQWVGDVDGAYNAYITNCNRLTPTNAQDLVVTNFNWQTSLLGNYYLPTNSPLINTGSVSAASVGLYHYTTLTNQVKETNSVVDVGLHYVAVDASGVAIDTDGDGVPDYIEDANGDGSVDGDPTSWRGYNSANGLSPGNGLQVFTPLK